MSGKSSAVAQPFGKVLEFAEQQPAKKPKRKRNTGRGYIKERRPGVWKIIVGGKGATVHGARADAEKRLTALLKELDDGKAIPRDNVTVGEWLLHWHKTCCIQPDL